MMQQADYTLGLRLSPRGRELLESGWIKLSLKLISGSLAGSSYSKQTHKRTRTGWNFILHPVPTAKFEGIQTDNTGNLKLNVHSGCERMFRQRKTTEHHKLKARA